jgi:hypothetical protein
MRRLSLDDNATGEEPERNEENVNPHGDQEGAMVHTGSVVREQLIKFMADSLRDLPDQQRVFLHLPRAHVGTEWSQWTKEAEPTSHGNTQRFRVLYVFFPGGEWDAAKACERLHQLWRIWGWTCTSGTPAVGDGHTLDGRSHDGYEFTLHATSQRRGSSLEVVSPQFNTDADSSTVSMPFAVTPFGELSLPHIWAAYPELVKW